MACHYCINCPRCKSGCSICRRCACSPAELDAWLNEQVKPFALTASQFIQAAREAGADCLGIANDPESLAILEALEEPQKPETD